jgi:hypothetical protein
MDFRKIIEMWPNYIALSTDLDEVPSTVRKWHERNRVPPRVWPAMEKAGRKRGYNISIPQLMSLYMASDIKGKRSSSKKTASKPKKKAARKTISKKK